MVARRLILAMLVLLVISSILAALVPVDRDRLGEAETSSMTTTDAATTPEGELVRRTIAVDGDDSTTIELGLGDQLELVVTSERLADQVWIPAFGVTEDVDPDFPARFDVLALERGRFEVRLVEAKRTIARIDVAAPRRGGKPKRRG